MMNYIVQCLSVNGEKFSSLAEAALVRTCEGHLLKTYTPQEVLVQHMSYHSR